MAKFHKLKVKEVTPETPDSVSIAFDIPANLKNEYKYIQGQYITFKLNINGEEVRRSYSLCSSPLTDSELRIVVKKVKNGKGSVWLNSNIKQGDEIEIMTPMGNFYTPTDPGNKKNYILIAGGSGITPMLSIIKTILKAEPLSKLTLFYGNRDEASIIFKNQLHRIATQEAERFRLFHIIENIDQQSAEITKGILTTEKIELLIRNHVDLNSDNEFFICGPAPMMDNAKKVLTGLTIDNKKIHIEYFTAAKDLTANIENSTLKIQHSVTSKVTVILDGNKTSFQLKSDGESVLDSALEAGVDVPYACKGAVCCTCRAKIIEGRVKMDMNYALTDDEVSQGYVLTCQSHPITPVLIVDYDHL